jgi:AraC-like DNA-binding protein
MLVNEVRIDSVRRLEQAALTTSPEKNSCHLLFVLEGNGTLNIDGTSHYFKENDCLLLHEFSSMSVKPGYSIPTIMQIIIKILNTDLAAELYKCQTDINISNQLSRSLVLKIWNDSILKPPYYEDSVKISVMYLLLLILAGKQSKIKKQPVINDTLFVASQSSEDINTMLEYIENHISEDIAICDLAKSVNMTPKQVNRLFKEHYNQTPIQFINNLRISKSKELLLYSEYNITEIADLTGFKTIHYFSRYFKEKEKISPLAYKEAMKCSNDYAV